MKILDKLKNAFFYNEKYKVNSEAVIIACYFNPQNNPYRLEAFNIFYESIKHLDHRIIECCIGDTPPQLEKTEFITRISTPNLLWHKESILNLIIKQLPIKYKYIFWLDADVIFTNNNWLVDSVKVLETHNICQPFEYCVHLDQDQLTPSFDFTHEYAFVSDPKRRHPKMWRSFCANVVTTHFSDDCNYDRHGHVGFAWGARREVLESVPLYDRALIGGADHIMAHAAAGHIPHTCITNSFTDNITEVNSWSRRFYGVVHGSIGYAKGNLYHIWHGDIAKRQYLKRIKDFTPTTKTIIDRDANGLHVSGQDLTYVNQYFDKREVKTEVKRDAGTGPKVTANRYNTSKLVYYTKRAELVSKYPDSDSSFIDSMIWGYITDSTIIGGLMGGNMAGAMLGDALNTQDQPVDFGGGNFGGGGSGGSWGVDTDTQVQSNAQQTDVIVSENFS
jgi:hypothetical protein